MQTVVPKEIARTIMPDWPIFIAIWPKPQWRTTKIVNSKWLNRKLLLPLQAQTKERYLG